MALALALAGCAQPARQVFDLAAPAAGAPSRLARPGGPALSVRMPSATPPTGSERIVVRASDGSVAVLPQVQWSAGLPRLLQERMIESLQRAGVAAAAVTLGPNALATDIQRFEIDVARDVAVVEINARIVDVNTGAARAFESFSAEAPAPDHTGAPAALALTQASAQALSRLAAWARGKL